MKAAAAGPCSITRKPGMVGPLTPNCLEKAGVSWKIYQDIGEGLDAAGFWGWTGDKPYIGNYGDNSLLYFHQYQKAPDSSPLAQKARNRTYLQHRGNMVSIFRRDY